MPIPAGPNSASRCIGLDEFVRRFPRGLPRPEAELSQIGREQFGPILSRPGRLGLLVAALRADRALAHCRGAGAPRRHRREPQRMQGKLDARRPAAGRSRSPPRRTASTGSPAAACCWSTTRPARCHPTRDRQAGFAPQLPLEGAILRDGGFKGLRGSAAALEYWRLSGGDPAGERCPIAGGDRGALIDR